MNEATASIINTIVTVTGIILAFITALVAEPIKNNIEHKSKIKQLRLALYKEMIHNYLILPIYAPDGKDEDKDRYTVHRIIHHELRVECYQHTIENEISCFYQLEEANSINYLYAGLTYLLNLENDLNNVFGEIEAITPLFLSGMNAYLSIFAQSFYVRTFSRKVLKEISKPEQYEEILARGKAEPEKAKSQEQSHTDNVDAQSA